MKGLIDLIANIGFKGTHKQARDTLGRVYEYFLGNFAQAEGKLGGEFYTPRCVVRVLVEMLEPYEGRVYDPCCGSGGPSSWYGTSRLSSPTLISASCRLRSNTTNIVSPASPPRRR
jgi:type I restriction-modification system DNA methylase subunit